MDNALEQRFTLELRKNCEQAIGAGCNQSALLRSIDKYGGVSTAKEYIRRNRLTDGFDLLAQKGLLKLSLEALAVSSRYGTLFTDDEVNRCFEALVGAGFYG